MPIPNFPVLPSDPLHKRKAISATMGTTLPVRPVSAIMARTELAAGIRKIHGNTGKAWTTGHSKAAAGRFSVMDHGFLLTSGNLL